MPLRVCSAWLEPDNQDWWDSKIGMCFFVKYVAVQRVSKNRPAGIIETKSTNVDKKVFIETATEKLLPATEEKWSPWARNKISIQMDNALDCKKLNKNVKINSKLKEMAASGWEIDFV